ncbi:MAG: hypothetical protein AAF616_02675 [Bacteroidota bacterium]
MKKALTIIVIVLVCGKAISQQVITDYENQKKSAIKMEFFSPLTGNTTLGFERYLKDWLSWEIKAGIIGLGTDVANSNPGGVFFRGGPKFKLNPDFVTSDTRGSHLLSGKYIRPEIAFAQYSESLDELDGSSVRTKESYTALAILITYGRQYTLADVMTLDYYFGAGYGYNSNDGGKYNYGFATAGSDFPIAFTAGFTIGFLLK